MKTSDDRLTTPAGTLHLQRYQSDNPTLRAWDAADELLLAEAERWLEPGQKLLVVDDSHGALALGLAHFQPLVISDSAGLAPAVAHNARLNGLEPPACFSWLDPQSAAGLPLRPPGDPGDSADLIVMKVPRHKDYLEFLLRWASDRLAPGGRLLTGGMIKHIPDQSVGIYQRLVSTEAVLPARKKARVVVCRSGSGSLGESWPGLWKGYRHDGLDLQGLPAVFGRERLDAGTGLLLPEIIPAVETLPAQAQVLDLACGNGILGLSVLARRPDVRLTFADISSQALISARRNLNSLALPENAEAQPLFLHSDGMPEAGDDRVPEEGYDLILLNPPFHEGGIVGDHIALRLFADAARLLNSNGQLLIVGNRHLGYHRSLRRFFSNTQQLAASPGFVVFSASSPRS